MSLEDFILYYEMLYKFGRFNFTITRISHCYLYFSCYLYASFVSIGYTMLFVQCSSAEQDAAEVKPAKKKA